MFGPVGRPSATAARRPRRRRVVLIVAGGLLAIIVATLIDQLVGSYPAADRRSALSWEAAVSPIIAGSSSLGAVLQTFRSTTAADEQRAVLDATLQALVLGTREEASSAASIGIAAPSARARTLLATTLNDRASAAQTLLTAVDLATGPNGDVALATTQLVATGALLRHSDAAYQALRGSLQHGGSDLLPASKWLGDPSLYSEMSAAQFAAALQAARALAEQSRLTIVALSVEPLPDRIVGLPTITTTAPTTTTTLAGTHVTTSTLATTGGSVTTTSSSTTTTLAPTPTTLELPPAGSRSYLLPTATITVSVVVANAGASTIDDVDVTASLTPISAVLSTPHATRARLGALAPGQSRSVELASLAVPKNATCLLRVDVSGVGVASVRETATLVTAR